MTMVEKSKLDNGIRILTERIPTAHSVSLGIWVENGSRHEQPAQNGISHFIEHMLFKGTKRRRAMDIAKEVDSVGGVLNAFTSREYSCYYAKVLAKKLPFAMDLLSDLVLNSVFDSEEIEKERRVILQEIFMVDDTPDEQVHDLFSESFWKGHPLGCPVLGTPETVGSLSREGILSFMKERYCGENIIVCAAGDLEHEAIVEAVGAAFHAVPAGRRAPAGTLPEFHRGVRVLEKDLEQVHLCLGTRSLSQSHPNRFASFILNVILGGSMGSRLFQKVREERGLAYSVYSYLNNHSDVGSLVLYAGTSGEETSEVVDIMLGEFRNLRDENVGEDELHSAKEQLKGHLLLSMESTDNRMTRIAKNEIYLGRQLSLKEVMRGFDSVTLEDLRKLAEFTFKDDYLNLQVVGKCRGEDFPLERLTLG